MFKNPVRESVSIAQSNRSLLVFERNESTFLPFWHYHPELELTLITSGGGLRFVGDSIETYVRGDLVLLGENLPHQWVAEEQETGTPNQATVLQFKKGYFTRTSEFSELLPLLSTSRLGRHFPGVSADLWEKITSLVHAPLPLQLGELTAILYDLMGIPQRTLSSTDKFNVYSSDSEQARINDALNFVLNNLDQRLSVNLMAGRCHMAPQSFCRWFKRHTGSSFVTYLNKSRIETACRELLMSDKPVQDVAYSTGFGNVSHFNRTFRKYTGTSPREFRVSMEN